MDSRTVIDTLNSWIEAIDSIDYFYKNAHLSEHRYIVDLNTSFQYLRNETVNYGSSDVAITPHKDMTVEISCLSLLGKDGNNTDLLLLPRMWKVYRNYSKYIAVVKNLIKDYRVGCNVRPVLDHLKHIASIAAQERPQVIKKAKVRNGKFFTEKESQRIVAFNEQLQKLYAEPLAGYGIYDISMIESIVNLGNGSFHVSLNTPDHDEIIAVHSKNEHDVQRFRKNKYAGKNFTIPVRTDRKISHLLENVATILVQVGVNELSSLKRIYVNRELNGNFRIFLDDGRMFDVTKDADLHVLELDTDDVKEDHGKRDMNTAIEDIKKAIGLLVVVSRSVKSVYDDDAVRKQYYSMVAKLFPELPNQKRRIEKKIDYLVERVYLLEQWKKACKDETLPYVDDFEDMTNDEILDEIEFLNEIEETTTDTTTTTTDTDETWDDTSD